MLLFGWQLWRSNGDDDAVAAVEGVEDVEGGVSTTSIETGDSADDVAVAPIGDDAEAPVNDDQGADDDQAAGPATSATTAAAAEAVAGVAPETVQSVLDTLPGAAVASTDGSLVIIEGFVANQAESDDAEAAVLQVAGAESVDNRLVILEPAVEGALTDAGVLNASAEGIGTGVTVRGTIATEDDRQPSVEAAAAVPGVTSVDDQLSVSVTAELNDLPQVQFRTGSAEILPESFRDLEAAAALLNDSGGASIEIQGYTDIVGDETANQRLSEDRANAVRQYLIDNGEVEADLLTAVGYGETEQFGAGDSPEALAENRLVRFVELG